MRAILSLHHGSCSPEAAAVMSSVCIFLKVVCVNVLIHGTLYQEREVVAP